MEEEKRINISFRAKGRHFSGGDELKTEEYGSIEELREAYLKVFDDQIEFWSEREGEEDDTAD